MAAVGELEGQYGDQVEFTIVPAAETARRGDEIALYGFTDLKHGLVGFTAQGEARVKLPGHQFGKPEIEAAIQKILP